MNIVQKIKIAALVLISSFILVGVSATAVQAGPFDGSRQEACKGANLSNNGDCKSGQASTELENAIKFVINLLTIIVGIVAVVLIIINGLKFITSNGDSNAISSAKHGVIYAIVGLIIVALAQVIVRFVLSKV